MPDDTTEWDHSDSGAEPTAEAETHELEGSFPAFAETELKPRKQA